MAGYKGSGIAFIKDRLERAGADTSRAFLERLSPATAEVFDTALAMSWVPVSAMEEVFAAAAELLFSSEPERRDHLSRPSSCAG